MEFVEDSLRYHLVCPYEDLRDDHKSLEFTKKLIEHGWGSIRLCENQFALICRWETVFSQIFSLPLKELKGAGVYRSVQGVSVGYRHDTERQFVECRLQTDGQANPEYAIESYDTLVRDVYTVLCEIGEMILCSIAQYVGLEKDTFVRLTDLKQRGRLPYRPKTSKKNNSVSNDPQLDEKELDDRYAEETLSSSLLRICRYEGTLQHESVSTAEKDLAKFGAHTDTSFLTIGLSSSTPALDIFDPIEKRWIMAESSATPPNTVHIFLGEFLQVLTNHYVRASIHRVNNFSSSLPARISCPLIVRGTASEAVRYHTLTLTNNTTDEAESDQLNLIGGFTLPDLEGVQMKIIHKILDFKRQKCFEKYGSQEGNWVLAAYPPLVAPPDTI